MRKMILGTDWWTDCDDAVAVRLLCRAVKRGEIGLPGIGIDACMEDSAASLSAFLKAEGVTGTAIGLDRDAVDFGGRPKYQKRIAEMPHDIDNASAEDADAMYLRLLRETAARGEKLEILEIGFPQVLARTILREPALFAETVTHVWMMAGKWDEDGGKENNFCRNARSRAAAAAFCASCPVPVTFLGWEVGATVLAGGRLPEGDMLHQVLVDHGSAHGRSAWDPMLVQLALTGDPARAGYTVVRGTAAVDAATGKNRFVPSPDGLHEYVVKAQPDDWYHDLLDAATAP